MKILLAAGGSGGHVFPALETAKILVELKHEVVFLTTHGLAFELVSSQGFPVWVIASARMRLASCWGAVTECVRMTEAIYQSWRLIQDLAPDVVVGFGGYGAFPVVLAGVVQRKPSLIHDQNVVPSWSNRVLAPFVNRIAISFERSQEYFRSPKVVWTGCPCRDQLSTKSKEEIYREFGFSAQRPTIFVLGGSQGSHKINQAFSQAVALLKQRLDFQFIHVCGQADYQTLKDFYERLDISFQLFPFLKPIEDAYAIADLVIARSGAATVSEVMSLQKKAIFIPYPLVRVHQKENAEIACAQGLATILADDACTSQRLLELMIASLFSSQDRERPKPSHQQRREYPAYRIAREIAGLQ